jgi:DNA polymerase sigma
LTNSNSKWSLYPNIKLQKYFVSIKIIVNVLAVMLKYTKKYGKLVVYNS